MTEPPADLSSKVDRERLGIAPWLFLAGLYVQRTLQRWVILGFAAVKSIYIGLWFGVLRRRQLWALDHHYYSNEPRYRDRDHNLGGLAAWEGRAVERHFTGCSRLLVTGAGGGREVLALTRLGFDVLAEECNPALVDLANGLLAEADIAANVTIGPRDACGLVGRSPVDGVIVGWGVFTHIQGRDRRIAYLRQLRGLVVDGGPILVSFFERPQRARMMKIVRASANLGRVLPGWPRVELGDVLDPHFQHYFTEQEIEDELRAAGFELVEYSTDGYAHAVGRAADLIASPEAAADRS